MKVLDPIVTSRIVQKSLTAVADSSAMRKGVNWASEVYKGGAIKQDGNPITRYNVIQEYFPLALGVWVGLVQTVLTYRSKDMPKERRVPLALSIGISDAIGLVGTLLINGKVNKFTKRVQDRVDKLPIEKVEKETLKNGVKTAVPLIIFAVMFKYAAQVISTPLANLANNYLQKKGVIDYSNEK